MKKVLFISHYTDLYGANLSLLGIIKDLTENRHAKIFVALPINRHGVNQMHQKLLNLKDVKVFRLFITPWMLSINTVRSKRRLYKLIFNILNEFAALYLSVFCYFNKIDIVHSNSFALNVGVLIKKYYRCKHVWHIRELYKEHYNLSFTVNEKKAKKIVNSMSDRFICISEYVKQNYTDLIDKKKMQVIYNGFDLRNFDGFKGDKLFGERIELTTIGVIHPSKAQEDSIKAMNVLIKRGYKNIKLNIVGEAKYEGINYIKKLKRIIDENELEYYIDFTGHVNDITKILTKTTIGIVSSQHEAFGRTTVEFMLSKCPVIASDSGASKEVLGGHGLVYQPHNYMELAEKIEKLVKNRKLYKDIQLKSFAYAWNKYDIATTSGSINALYNEILRVK